MAWALVSSGTVFGATLDVSTNLNARPPIPLAGGTQNVRTNTSGVYDFGDRNGDNTRDDAVAPPGLDFGACSLFTDSQPNSPGIALNLNGGDITNGNSAGTSLSTCNGYVYGDGKSCGSVAVKNAGRVSLGTVDTHLYGGNNNNSAAGAIQFGEPSGSGSGPVGRVRVANLWAYGSPYGAGGAVSVYATGAVVVATASGTYGNIDSSSGNATAGSVGIYHGGAFAAARVHTSAAFVGLYAGGPASGSATFVGNYTGAGASGTFQVDGIDTSRGPQPYDVRFDGNAGNITITNITGDIRIDGPIIASSAGTGTRGILSLTAGGGITVSNLNLSLVRLAVFNGAGQNYVLGQLRGTNGVPAASVADLGSALRLPAGQIMRYAKKANPALNAQTLQVANPDGTPGAGGKLIAFPGQGTTMIAR